MERGNSCGEDLDFPTPKQLINIMNDARDKELKSFLKMLGPELLEAAQLGKYGRILYANAVFEMFETCGGVLRASSVTGLLEKVSKELKNRGYITSFHAPEAGEEAYVSISWDPDDLTEK